MACPSTFDEQQGLDFFQQFNHILATDYVDKWTPMVTSVEFLNDVIKGLEVLIVFLNVLFILFHEDKILGSLPHRLDGLFGFLVIEVDLF